MYSSTYMSLQMLKVDLCGTPYAGPRLAIIKMKQELSEYIFERDKRYQTMQAESWKTTPIIVL